MTRLKFIAVTLVLLVAAFTSGCRPSGCTDSSATNYDPNARIDDGSCIPRVYGCTDPNASNYYSSANTDDGSCAYTTQITVWTGMSTFPCNTAGINVYIDDSYIGTLNSYYTSTPGCGASGGASISVEPGTHKFYAQCSSGSTTWGPYYYSVSGSCYKWQLY
jgi:hypothetical protein